MLTLKELGQKLKNLRDDIGYSQEFVAGELGISRQAIISIEAGKRKVDSFELFRLAGMYGVSATDLISGNEKVPAVANFKEAVLHLRKNNLLDEKEKKALLDFQKICEDYEFLKNL